MRKKKGSATPLGEALDSYVKKSGIADFCDAGTGTTANGSNRFGTTLTPPAATDCPVD